MQDDGVAVDDRRRHAPGLRAASGFERATLVREQRLQADTRLVVCDVNMPRMSGIEFLETLHERRGRRIPVVMLTTEGQPELIARAKALGAIGWIVKPFKPELLVATAKKLAG